MHTCVCVCLYTFHKDNICFLLQYRSNTIPPRLAAHVFRVQPCACHWKLKIENDSLHVCTAVVPFAAPSTPAPAPAPCFDCCAQGGSRRHKEQRGRRAESSTLSHQLAIVARETVLTVVTCTAGSSSSSRNSRAQRVAFCID